MSNYKSGKRYADVLTVLLVIIIIAIICLLGYFGYKAIDKKSTQTNASNAADEFEQKLENADKNNDEEENVTNEVVNETNNESTDISGLINHNATTNTSSNTNNNSNNNSNNKTYLGDYEVKGVINIPKTGIKYPILEKVTVDSLTKSVAILDITTCSEITQKVTSLNVPGSNVLILGHNYRNGMFFSDNDKLVVGDSIKITDADGNVVTYKIYDMYYTTPSDISFMERDIDPNTREITLQTCNDDSSQRLIIQARDK